MAERLNIIIDAKDHFSGAFGKLKSMMPSMKQLAVGAGAAFVGLGTAIIATAKTTATAYDATRKFADQLGVGTEFLSKYAVAADFSGVKAETFNKSIQMLQVRIGEAAKGIGQGKDAMDQLGVSLYTTAGQLKTSEQILPELADAFHNMSNATERAEAASKVFGQRGMAMLQMFTKGSAGLAEMTAEAEKFGLVISEKAANNAAAFNDSLTRMGGSLKGVKNAIAEELMPTLAGLANKFADFVAENRMQIVGFATTFLKSMGKMVEYGAYGVATMMESWRGLQMVWSVLKIAFAELSIALNKGINFLVEKLQWMLEKVNFRGIFDNDIKALNAVKSNVSGAIDEMVAMKETALANLSAVAGDTSAFEKIAKIKEYFKNAMAEIRAAGEGADPEPKGVGVLSTSNVEKSKENLSALQEMRDKYYLSDLEQQDKWYGEQLDKYKANKDALILIEEIHQAKLREIGEASAQGVTDSWMVIQNKQLEFQAQTLELLKEEATVFSEIMNTTFEAVSTGIAQAAGAAIFEAKSMGEALSALMKSIAQTIVVALIKVAVQRLILMAKNLFAGTTETIARMGQLAMQTYAGAFAATAAIPYVGPAIAPGVAAASTAAMLAGSAAAKVAGMAAGAAHGGLTNVPKEQTYLLDKGERVLSPNQNQELMDFIRSGGGGGMTIENQNNTFDIFPNATNVDALKYIEKGEWIEILNENLVPAMKELKIAGVM